MMQGAAVEAQDVWALRAHLARTSTWILFGVGIGAALLHAATRFPLHLPGHQGLAWMAVLMLARLASPYRWAASIAALGAAAVAPFLGFHDPLTPIAFLLPGAVLDLAAWMAPRNLTVLVLAAALGYTAQPVLDWLALQALHLHFGPQHPAFAAHALFGLTGALLGAVMWKSTRR